MDPEFGRDNRLTVERAENQLLVIMALVYQNPHPLGLGRSVISEFNLYMIATLKFRHGRPAAIIMPGDF